MQKWEYATIEIVGSQFGTEYYLQIMKPGQKPTKYKAAQETYLKLMQWMGEQGWELVSVTGTSGSGGTSKTYYFKRPSQA